MNPLNDAMESGTFVTVWTRTESPGEPPHSYDTVRIVAVEPAYIVIEDGHGLVCAVPWNNITEIVLGV